MLIPGPSTQKSTGTLAAITVYNSGFWEGKEGHYSPSKRASWTSDIMQISLNVRAWCVGKITSLSLDGPQVPSDPASPSIHFAFGQSFWSLQAMTLTPMERVRLGEGARKHDGSGSFLLRLFAHSVIH